MNTTQRKQYIEQISAMLKTGNINEVQLKYNTKTQPTRQGGVSHNTST